MGAHLGQLTVRRGADRCGGDRLDCGAYRFVSGLEVDTTFGPTTVAPGEVLELDATATLRMTVAVGRAELIAYTHEGCGVDRDDAGTSMDFALTYREEIE